MVGFDKVGILAKAGVEIQQSKVSGSEFLFVGKVWEKINRERADLSGQQGGGVCPPRQMSLQEILQLPPFIVKSVFFFIKLVSMWVCVKSNIMRLHI